MSPEAARRALHRVADMVADRLESPDRYPVLPRLEPGAVRSSLSPAPPAVGETLDTILDDYARLVEPGSTQWNHPGFMAYFAISASAPGILAETLAATLNVNAMLWRTGPAATEMEELVCDWLRQMLQLPPEFRGHINDTASIGSFLALAAARHRADPTIRELGLAARADLQPMTVYAGAEAHSSIDKAVVALGLGLVNLRRVPTDDTFRMDVAALAATIQADRGRGERPVAVVATAGTTSTTSVDPLRATAEVCAREGLWLHVDAAYAGSAAICPEYRALLDGLELADSVVLNPHKWLFTPLDCSVLLVRDPGALRAAFSVVPEYLRTTSGEATNLMDYGIQLGRRFRALKLWMVIRAFGVEGLRARIRTHCELARDFAARVRAEPGFEVCAPVPFSTVCFRATPAVEAEEQDRVNERILERVNASGEVFLSHTRLRGRHVLRLAIGNLWTGPEHVARAWELVREVAGEARASPP
ncbi:MAG: amino acid decarboxylase [Gemmatimonadetes bacterium]|nr:amino acid decarboxylase [Gemmatimonadota bacterium]